MVVIVKNLVSDCSTNAQGEVIYTHVSAALDRGQTVELSFTGVYSVSSSFLNSSIIELIDRYGFDFIKAHVRITGVNKHVAQLISHRIKSEMNAIGV